MTADELIAKGQRLLEFGCAQLEDEGYVDHAFHIVFADHDEVMVVASPRLDSKGKAAITNTVKARVRDGGALAVMMLADVDLSSNFRQGAPFREHVLVSIESPSFFWMVGRAYRLCGKRGKRGTRIEWGETKLFALPGDGVRKEGNFTGFFPERASGSNSEPPISRVM